MKYASSQFHLQFIYSFTKADEIMKELYICELKALLSKQLLQYRRRHKLTQAQLAERLMIDPRSYIELEHGKSLCGTLVLLMYLSYCCEDIPALLAQIKACLEKADSA